MIGLRTYHFFFLPPYSGHIVDILPLPGPVIDIFRPVSNIPLLYILHLFIDQRSIDNCRGNLMEVKKLAVYGFVAFAVLTLAMPAGAWIGPFGGCGFGFGGFGLGLGLGLGCGLGFSPFGLFGPFGPFGLIGPFGCPVPVPVPVPVPAPVPAAVPACGPVPAALPIGGPALGGVC